MISELEGYIVGSMIIVSYYGFMIYALNQVDLIEYIKKTNKNDVIYIMSIACISVFFILRESALNNVIYSWDSFINWCPAVIHSEALFYDSINSLKVAYSSINNTDYNDFLGLIMALPLHIIGKDFIIFTLIVWSMFFLPSAVVLIFSLNKFFEMQNLKIVSYPLMFILLLLIPAVSSQVFYGYAYISFLLPGAVMLALVLEHNNKSLKKYILLGLLSILLVIQNRTSTYMVIGFWIATLSFDVFYLGNYKKEMLILIKKYTIVFISNILILTIFFNGFFERSVFNNFKTAYSAYALGLSLIERYYGVFLYLGIVVIITAILGFILGIIRKELRAISFMMIIWTLIPIVMLNMILQMNGHQMYDIIIPLYVLISILFVTIINYINKYKLLMLVTYSLLFIFSINFFYAFSEVQRSEYWGYQHHPLKRDDVDSVRYVVSQLQNLCGEDKRLYVISSGATLNDDCFRRAYFPKEIISLPTIQPSPHVDLRDGFNLTFFDSDIVVVLDPIQTHMLPKDQQVVIIPAEVMLSKNIYSDKFNMISEYVLYPNKSDLTSEIRVKVFERKERLNILDVNYIEEKFDDVYPNEKKLFHDRFEKYKKEKFEKIDD